METKMIRVTDRTLELLEKEKKDERTNEEVILTLIVTAKNYRYLLKKLIKAKDVRV